MEIDVLPTDGENSEARERLCLNNVITETILCENMLNHVASSKHAHFKSQQVGDPELNTQQKRDIAKELLVRKPEQFLARFGNYLELQHLDYFSDTKYDSYEIQFHLRQLQRSLCKKKKQVDIRNRRYEALKKLLDEGIYFSETEMMKRNPLLYEQLIGQFLSRKEIRERDKRDDNAATFLSVLLDQLDKQEIEHLKQQQKDEEEAAVEEVDTSDEDTEEEDEVINGNEDSEKDEESDDLETSSQSGKEFDEDNENNQCSSHKQKKLSRKERELLREEFVTSMYQSFLDGCDKDFDYSSKVDGNPEYECLAVRTQDEEEKYFDSESPEIVSCEGEEPNVSAQDSDNEEEDELDLFMKNLKPEATPDNLANDMEKMIYNLLECSYLYATRHIIFYGCQNEGKHSRI